jgi:hypothetical protein
MACNRDRCCAACPERWRCSQACGVVRGEDAECPDEDKRQKALRARFWAEVDDGKGDTQAGR